MKNEITDEMIEYVGILSKLELNDSEKLTAKQDMENMLGYVDMLKELDTDGVEPFTNMFSVNNVFREDIVTNENQHDDMLQNAPQKKGSFFVVPKTV